MLIGRPTGDESPTKLKGETQIVIASIRLTDKGIEKLESFVAEEKDVNYLEATILACSQGSVTLSQIISRIEENYPFPIENSHITTKLLSLERQGLVSLVRDIEDSTMLLVQYDGLEFKTKFSDLPSVIDREYLRKEFPYSIVVGTPYNGKIITVKLA